MPTPTELADSIAKAAGEAVATGRPLALVVDLNPHQDEAAVTEVIARILQIPGVAAVGLGCVRDLT